MSHFELILVDPNPALCEAWRTAFADLPTVRVVDGYFEQLTDFDCLVSPANSFGLMDGGVDAAIIRYFGDALMRRVQQHILDEFRGEQPVGTSFIIETGHTRHPFLAHTPTMRVPLPISRTDHVYAAMYAMLLAVYRHNRDAETPIETVACPGLGTGVGRVPFAEAARQMALAYRHFLHPPQSVRNMHWPFATTRQDSIRRGGDWP